VNRSRRTAALLVSISFGWLLLFAHNGIRAPFSGDDLMNLHGYLSQPASALLLDNLRFWSTSYRPLGGLFYVSLWDAFGFNPLPFRLACFALLALNLGLLWRFTLRLSGSREIAFLALLLAGYHAWFVDLYYSTGTVYDLLCYAFFLGAFNFYLGIRGRGAGLSWRQTGILTALYICALNAKEMAVTLPLLLAAYEAVYQARAVRDGRLAWLVREGRGVLICGLATALYVAGKLTGPGSLAEVPAYHISISPVRYLHTFFIYLNPLLYQDHVFRSPNTSQLLLAMLAAALLLRSRPLLFAWCFVIFSLLPVAFIAHYAGFFLYLPMAGWALYAAVMLSKARAFLLALLIRAAKPGETWAARMRMASIAALPPLLALFLAPHHWSESARTLRLFESVQPPTRELSTELLALRPSLPKGARVLYLDDPLPKDGYTLLFLTRLLYHDMSIAVERAPQSPTPRGGFDAIFIFRDGRLAEWPGPG